MSLLALLKNWFVDSGAPVITFKAETVRSSSIVNVRSSSIPQYRASSVVNVRTSSISRIP